MFSLLRRTENRKASAGIESGQIVGIAITRICQFFVSSGCHCFMKKKIALLFLIGCAHATASQAERMLPDPDTDQLIIKFRPPEGALLSLQEVKSARMKTLSALADVPLVIHRESEHGQIVKLPSKVPLSDVHEIARRISASPDVLYAEPDKRLFPLNTPNDTHFYQQWNLQSPSINPGGINLPNAWDITTGLFSVNIAVIDSGILHHADLNGRLLPGYDFISDIKMANDGDGRDNDPTDPGNWVTAEEAATTFPGCSVSNSSWHGTHVTGIIGAASNNGIGIAGISWGSRILPVRTVGKCGGYTSDITDGMRWAAGLPIAGVPSNANPAKVLNVSLGGGGPCSITEQNAINDIVNAGAVVVVAAGNEAQNALNISPANCYNVVVVAAIDSSGSRASYTNYGSQIDISAPGGDLDYAGGAIMATSDSGNTFPNYDNVYTLKQGTSMAAPHVSGVVSLMFSVNPSLTPTNVKTILKSTARTFPIGTAWDCTTIDCGAGILDATAALNASYVAATSFQVKGIPSGGLMNKTLQATIIPTPEDINTRVNLYVGAKIGNQWFLRAGSEWVPWTGGPLPVFNSVLAISVISLTVAENMDASSLIGTEVYVGYGKDDADLLDQHKYGLIYTVN